MARTKHGLPGIYNASPITLPDGAGSALATNASGQLIAAAPTGSSANQVQGSAADNAAAVGNPVRVGAKYNSATQTYADGDIADLQADSQGRLKTTDAPRDYLVDDITIYGTNTEQASLTAGSLNADLMPSTDVSVYKSGIIQVAGTWSGTLTIQGANDNSGFNTILSVNIGSSAAGPQGTITGNGHFVFPIAHKFIRIRMTSYSSGTATGTLELMTMPIQLPVINTSVTASPSVSTVSVATSSTSVLAASSSRKALIFSNVGSNNIYLNLAGGTAIATNTLILPSTTLVFDRFVTTTAITGIAATGATNLSVTELT